MPVPGAWRPAALARSMRSRPKGVTSAPPVILDANVLVGAGFRPESASGRLVAAVRAGALRQTWTDATRGEAEAVLDVIPPLGLPVGVFAEAGRFDGPLDTSALPAEIGNMDRALGALALATKAPLVTSDRALAEAARTLGATVWSPSEAAHRLSLSVRRETIPAEPPRGRS